MFNISVLCLNAQVDCVLWVKYKQVKNRCTHSKTKYTYIQEMNMYENKSFCLLLQVNVDGFNDILYCKINTNIYFRPNLDRIIILFILIKIFL